MVAPRPLQKVMLGTIVPALVGASAAQAATVTLEPPSAGSRTFATSVGGWTHAESFGGIVCTPGSTSTTDATFVVPQPPANASPSAVGALDGRARTAIYDVTAGTLSARVEVLSAGGNSGSGNGGSGNDGYGGGGTAGTAPTGPSALTSLLNRCYGGPVALTDASQRGLRRSHSPSSRAAARPAARPTSRCG